jgi:hypothetical protein
MTKNRPTQWLKTCLQLNVQLHRLQQDHAVLQKRKQATTSCSGLVGSVVVPKVPLLQNSPTKSWCEPNLHR